MTKYIIVSLGAAIGGVLRYWLTGFTHKLIPTLFPVGTLAVNIIGSFILGIIIFMFDERQLLNPNIKLFLTIGICGGFTTMSTFSFETLSLFRQSQHLLALLNIIFNFFFSLLGIYLAYILSKL